jgi:pimeloyl-ACP methyl ester carboxylesterase
MQRLRAWVTVTAAVAIVGACGSSNSSKTGSSTTARSVLPPSSAVSSAASASIPATSAGAAASSGNDARRTKEGDLFFEHVVVNGTDVEYALVLPAGYDASKPNPVVFAFPPGGQDHSTTARVTADRWAPEAIKRGWVVLSPVATDLGLYYDGRAAALVPALLDALAARYPPEGGRFFLAGVSNGGLSAFRAALDHPERFRSLVVFPGYPPEAADKAKLAGLKNVPVAMFVGGDDSGWREESEATKATLDKLGGKVTLDIRKGEGHIITSLTGADLFAALEAARTG